MVMMMIKGRVMMLMTLTRNLNDGMELIEQPVIGVGGDNSIMKTLTNGMELAWHPVVGGLVEGDQGHRAAVGDVRHEPGGKHGVVVE